MPMPAVLWELIRHKASIWCPRAGSHNCWRGSLGLGRVWDKGGRKVVWAEQRGQLNHRGRTWSGQGWWVSGPRSLVFRLSANRAGSREMGLAMSAFDATLPGPSSLGGYFPLTMLGPTVMWWCARKISAWLWKRRTLPCNKVLEMKMWSLEHENLKSK